MLTRRFIPPEKDYSGPQAADRLRRVAFEGVVDVAEYIPAGVQGISDAPRPSVQQFVLGPLDRFVIGQGRAVVADEAYMQRQARLRILDRGLPVEVGVRLTGALDDDKTDLPLHQEADECLRHQIDGPDFDRQRNPCGHGRQPVDEIRQAASVAAAGKTGWELNEAGGGSRAEAAHNIQIGAGNPLHIQ